MTDQLEQQLSAFMDNELPEQESELFVRRLCKEDALKDTVNRYALIGDAMRGELLAADVQLGERIHAAIAADTDAEQAPATGMPSWLRPVSGIAVAATVAAVAVLSLQGFNGADSTEFPASTVAEINTDEATSLLPVNVPKLVLPEVRPASAVPQSRMDQYLLRHREYATGFGGQSVMGIRDVGSYTVVPVPAKPKATAEEVDKP